MSLLWDECWRGFDSFKCFKSKLIGNENILIQWKQINKALRKLETNIANVTMS